MDDLTAALAASFEISNDPNKTSAPHPRFSQFKCKPSNQDQDSRRRRLLESQKKNRFDFLSHVRKLTEDVWKDTGEEDDQEEKAEEGMEVEVKIRRPGRYYKDQLMLSEWLVEVPSDFAEEWLMVLCPVGKRNLVITNGNSTKAFARSGYFLNSFPSHLPGGNRRQQTARGVDTGPSTSASDNGKTSDGSKSPAKKSKPETQAAKNLNSQWMRDFCVSGVQLMGHASKVNILDCIYSEVNKTYYVLDLMCWNGHQIYETETEFRFYWMNEKWQENPELMEASKINPFKFVPLSNFPCTSEAISSAVSSANFEIDGLLFYHKRAHYMFGSTPLVVWLKPYMLPEILGISVPDRQLTHQPATYTDYASHMQLIAEQKEKSKERRQGQGQGRRGRRGHRRGQGRGRGQDMEAESLDDSGGGGEGGSFSENSGVDAESMDSQHSAAKAVQSPAQSSGDFSNYG